MTGETKQAQWIDGRLPAPILARWQIRQKHDKQGRRLRPKAGGMIDTRQAQRASTRAVSSSPLDIEGAEWAKAAATHAV